jgi:hypothetical protein
MIPTSHTIHTHASIHTYFLVFASRNDLDSQWAQLLGFCFLCYYISYQNHLSSPYIPPHTRRQQSVSCLDLQRISSFSLYSIVGWSPAGVHIFLSLAGVDMLRPGRSWLLCFFSFIWFEPLFDLVHRIEVAFVSARFHWDGWLVVGTLRYPVQSVGYFLFYPGYFIDRLMSNC